jgi:DNA-binding CsgD family transcriptional regulator
MQRHRCAVRATDVMAQADLLKTEFYNDFLGRDGQHWGANLDAWDGAENIGDLRVWRDRHHENFSEQDVAMLDLLRPALVAALRRCRTPHASMPTQPIASAGVLSARENELVSLASCGLTDKEIARRLGVSLSTVRTYLDHAFRKLGVDNRMKLVERLSL